MDVLICREEVTQLLSSDAKDLYASVGTTVDEVSGRRPDFGGMTVNERLSTAGLLGQFDAAIDAGDRKLGVELLTQVAMSEDSAAATVDAVLASPSKYGYPSSP